jgi:hypothetical protein
MKDANPPIDQSFNYKNFTYLLKGGNHEVNVDPVREEPQTVFKYYYNNDNSVNALTNNYLFATHPFSFNDSIDSSELLLNLQNITKERYGGLFQRLMKPEALKDFDFDVIFPQDQQNSFQHIRRFIYEYFTRQVGLISLTTQPLNILMWSHYSSESGFIIELDKQCLIDNLRQNNKDINNWCFRPIQYVDELESINMFQEGFKTPDLSFLYMTNVKRREWEYEDEWRLAIYKNDMSVPFSFLNIGSTNYDGTQERKIFYSKDCIQSLVVGKHFFNGKNCSKVTGDLIFTISNEKFKSLVQHIYENYNEKIFMSGELEKGSKFGRSISRITLKKIADDQFQLVDLKDIYTL